MDELRTLVEKRCVVFVAFGNEQLSSADTSARRKVSRYATNHEPRLAARMFKHPRKQRSRRGLSMGTRDNQRCPSANEVFLQRFGERGIPNLLLEDRFDFLVASTHRVTDDDEVRARLQVFRTESLDHRYSVFRKHRTHRRIGLCVRSGYAIPSLLEHECQRTHRGAADAGQVYMLNRRSHVVVSECRYSGYAESLSDVGSTYGKKILIRAVPCHR